MEGNYGIDRRNLGRRERFHAIDLGMGFFLLSLSLFLSLRQMLQIRIFWIERPWVISATYTLTLEP